MKRTTAIAIVAGWYLFWKLGAARGKFLTQGKPLRPYNQPFGVKET
jgi:hypothetical protein